MESKRFLIVGKESIAKSIVPPPDDATVITNSDFANNIFDEVYDVIVVVTMLETHARSEYQDILRTLWNGCKYGGEIIIVTHSLEWAAANMMSREGSQMYAYASIYGNDGRPHKGGFTLPWLRNSLRASGFLVHKATQLEVLVGNEDEQVQMMYNLVSALKTKGIEPVEIGEMPDVSHTL